jgi:hypothetical protein
MLTVAVRVSIIPEKAPIPYPIMSDFDPRIPRDLAVRLGEEAVAISKAGKYAGPTGIEGSSLDPNRGHE